LRGLFRRASRGGRTIEASGAPSGGRFLISRIISIGMAKELMEDQTIRTFIVDSFTDTAFKGNPAGVCIIGSQLSVERMLQIAQELNLSETAFLSPLESGNAFAIRYFSPKMEIPLCGHATLASAKVIFSIDKLNEVHFINIQNLDLFAKQSNGHIVMEFPIYETRSADAPPALLAALGIEVIKNAVYNEETKILLLEISDPEELANLDPDFAALLRSHNSINGVLVTAPSAGDGYDFHSRYFWPWSGTNEDPVTGGTHTFLAKYWASKLGKAKMKSFQSSKRTGFMEVELVADKLRIRSQAVIVFAGELTIEA
jgi:PhzF family phenazine biosynthesis protein